MLLNWMKEYFWGATSQFYVSVDLWVNVIHISSKYLSIIYEASLLFKRDFVRICFAKQSEWAGYNIYANDAFGLVLVCGAHDLTSDDFW